MILVFVFLSLIIAICLIRLILMLSTIKLDVKRLHIFNTNEQKKIRLDFILDISICFLNKFKIIKFTIDNVKIDNLISSKKINIQNFKYDKKINQDIIDRLKYSDFKIEYLKLEGYFATFDTVLTSYIFSILHAIIPIIVSKKLSGKYINKIEFLNINENVINLGLNCIISIKMVNIINILHYLIKKGGIKNNGKSSYRRSYAYSNE